jgi:hypothetical protein
VSTSVRLLTYTLLAALTQLPASDAMTAATAATVLTALLVIVAMTRQSLLPLVASTVPPMLQTRDDRLPVLRQAVVAGPGRPQPRAPGARSCAAS